MYRNNGLSELEFGKHITLTITNYCNLKCSYCYEHNKDVRVMSFETAQEILSHELDETSDNFTVEIFGGEAFTNFQLIKQITEYLETRFNQKNFWIFIVSNGTLVNKDIQVWLLKHKKHVIVGLSLDGTKEMHDCNRSNSYDMIDVDFFCRTYPSQSIKMTISNATLNNMTKGIKFLHSKGFKINCNLAYGIDWQNDKYQYTLYKQLKELADYYIENNNILPCSMLSFKIEHVRIKALEKAKRSCGCGVMHTYDVDGKRYPCQMFMPLSMGEKSKCWGDLEVPDDIDLSLLDSKCRKCLLIDICPSCYGSNYAASGNLFHKDDGHCIMMKIIFLANSYYRWNLVKGGFYDKDPDLKLLIMRGIKTIQQEMSKDPIISGLRRLEC